MAQKCRVLIDTIYSQYLSDMGVSLDELIQNRYPQWFVRFANRVGLVRGFLFFWLGRSHELLVTACDVPGSWTTLFLEAWVRRRGQRVVLLEFIRKQPGPSAWRRLVYPLWFRAIAKPAVQRAMRVGHVLTSWELDHYAAMFEVPKDRFHFIPWPLRSKGDKLPSPSSLSDTQMVLSSGRHACDWDTLFRAARGREWPLTVVCTKRDLAHVQRLNRGGRARILCDIGLAEHQTLLRSAAVYVMSMRETMGSTGQVRLANAVRAGVPVVATRIRGLDGYIIDGETGLLVEPGDWAGLREAIERLLADPGERRRLRRRAFERASEWTREQYFASVRRLVQDSVLYPRTAEGTE